VYVVLVFLFVSNVFTALLAMDDPGDKFSFHQVVSKVATGYDLQSAKETLKNLHAQGKSPNVLSDGKTAAVLNAHRCVEDAIFFENKLETLEILLSFDGEEESNFNKKSIIEYLNKEQLSLGLSLRGLKQRPFKKVGVYGGGYFIDDDDDDDDDEERLGDELSRINRVRALVKEAD